MRHNRQQISSLCSAARACKRPLALLSSGCPESLQPPPTASAAPRRPARPPFPEAEAECKRRRKEGNSALLTTCTQSTVRASLRAHVLPGPLSQGNLHRTPVNLSLGSSHLSPLRLLSLFSRRLAAFHDCRRGVVTAGRTTPAALGQPPASTALKGGGRGARGGGGGGTGEGGEGREGKREYIGRTAR